MKKLSDKILAETGILILDFAIGFLGGIHFQSAEDQDLGKSKPVVAPEKTKIEKIEIHNISTNTGFNQMNYIWEDFKSEDRTETRNVDEVK